MAIASARQIAGFKKKKNKKKNPPPPHPPQPPPHPPTPPPPHPPPPPPPPHPPPPPPSPPPPTHPPTPPPPPPRPRARFAEPHSWLADRSEMDRTCGRGSPGAALRSPTSSSSSMPEFLYRPGAHAQSEIGGGRGFHGWVRTWLGSPDWRSSTSRVQRLSPLDPLTNRREGTPQRPLLCPPYDQASSWSAMAFT